MKPFTMRWLALMVLTAAAPGTAQGQAIDEVFPSGVAGYDQAPGVTVQTRQRSLYDEAGVRLPGFDLRPYLEQSLVLNSNPLGDGSSGSVVSQSSGAVSAASNWTRNRVAATAGFGHVHYLDRPIDYTDFNGAIAGGYTLLDQELAAAFSHQSFHTLGTAIATTRSTSPLLNQTDTARLSYLFASGRLSFAPELTATAYRYGNATTSGVKIDQKFFNRDVLTAAVTTRFANTDRSSMLVVVRGIDSHFVNPQPSVPSLNSKSVLLLAGTDYQARGPWGYRVLIGGELRGFESKTFITQVMPILEASVTWTPTGFTTFTGTSTRTINDPQSGGSNGYTLTSASIRADYELQRNILLKGHAIFRMAEFFQGGMQTSTNFGASSTWLLNRNVRAVLSYNFTQQSGAGPLNRGFAGSDALSTDTRTGRFSQSLIGLTLRLGL